MHRMLSRIGFASFLAIFGFIAGVVMAWVNSSSWLTPVENGTLGAVLTFLAALVCMGNDSVSAQPGWKIVRRRLNQRDDVLAEAFCERLPGADPDLLLKFRLAVALYFDVRPEKIHPDDDLAEDYRHLDFTPSIFFCAASAVDLTPSEHIRPFGLDEDSPSNYHDLATEISRLLRESDADDQNTI